MAHVLTTEERDPPETPKWPRFGNVLASWQVSAFGAFGTGRAPSLERGLAAKYCGHHSVDLAHTLI
jgi:hypothetical protein